MDHVKFRDVFRAQYYLKGLQEATDFLSNLFANPKYSIPCGDLKQLAHSILQQISDQQDNILLPVVAHEIAQAKERNKLHGNSPEERYESFFITNNGKEWTTTARELLNNYPVLKKSLCGFLETTLQNIGECFERLNLDLLQLVNIGLLKTTDLALEDIHLSLGDRHQGGRCTMALSFSQQIPNKPSQKHQIVYKPTSLEPDELLSIFVSKLDLEAPYNLTIREVLNKGEYGWLSFVHYTACGGIQQVENYYKRAGCILAVLDSLNYCDGHFENIVACGEHPILLDCETLFQFFGFDATKESSEAERSVLNTGLIEKPPKKDSGKGYSSAFQAPTDKRFEFLHPYALDDGTDELKVRYRGIALENTSHHCPFVIAVDFKDDFIQGYTHGYNAISCHATAILDDEKWFFRMGKAKCRQLVRHTLYYSLLLHKLHQPDLSRSLEEATQTVLTLLRGPYFNADLENVSGFELAELLQLNIPFFYHFPEHPHLYDATNKYYEKYESFFIF